MSLARPTLGAEVEVALRATLEESRGLGFLGPGPVEAHIAHALDFACLLPATAARALDLGSGGGVPGLVLLAALPDIEMVLLDANQRRTQFLDRCLARFGWEHRAEVVTARAEEAAHRPGLRHGIDVVLSRSFASPAATAECGAPFLRLGGRLVVSEPPDQVERWPAEGLARLGLRSELLGEVVLERRFAVMVSVALCEERYPRRVGVPAKRPLFGPSVPQET